MNGEELVQKIEKTNNIKKLNRILKRIDFDRIDADTLAKIIEILKNKNGIYQS